MGTASKFDEFPTSFEDEAFGDGGGSVSASSPAPEEDSEDEEQLIKDGNDQVLKSFESRKKTQEYSRSQVSREKKAPELSMDIVDWSGFPGAAHTSPAVATLSRKSRSQRLLGGSASKDGSSPTGKDAEKRGLVGSRSHQRKLAAAKGIGSKSSEDGNDMPHSPKKEPQQKYRNRRHSFKGTGPASSLSQSMHGDSAHGHAGRAARRSSLNLNGGSNHRPMDRRQQRRGSGSGKRNPRTTAHTDSTSPSGRIRRPVNAAAASTMLEGGRKPPQRTGSNGRRQRSQRLGGSNGILKVPDDGVLAQKSSSIKW